MSRISLMMVAVAVAAGVVGCAQCDTCDDFPAPCTGPNCGGNAAMLAPTMTQGGPPVMGVSPAGPTMENAPPANPPASDSDGPGPVVPPTTPSPMTPPVDPASPPPPMDPSARPN